MYPSSRKVNIDVLVDREGQEGPMFMGREGQEGQTSMDRERG